VRLELTRPFAASYLFSREAPRPDGSLPLLSIIHFLNYFQDDLPPPPEPLRPPTSIGVNL